MSKGHTSTVVAKGEKYRVVLSEDIWLNKKKIV